MVKVLHDSIDMAYIIVREGKKDNCSDNLITIGKIKEVVHAIGVLHNNPNTVITVDGGCIDVVPVENVKDLKIDPVIFRRNEVTKLNINSFNVMIDNHEYKTKKINDSYIYEGVVYYTNRLERVVIRYYKRDSLF